MSWFHRNEDIRKQNAKNILIALSLAFGVFIFVYVMQGGSLQVASDAASPVCNKDCRRNGLDAGDMVCKNRLWTCKDGVCNGGVCTRPVEGLAQLGDSCDDGATNGARRGQITPGMERVACASGLQCIGVRTEQQGNLQFCCDAARSHPNCKDAYSRVVAPNP